MGIAGGWARALAAAGVLVGVAALAVSASAQAPAETRQDALIRGMDQCLALRAGADPASYLPGQGFRPGERADQWGRVVEGDVVQLYIDRTSEPGSIGCSVATWPALESDDRLRAAVTQKAARLELGDRIVREDGGARFETWETTDLNLGVLRTAPKPEPSMSAIVMIWSESGTGSR
ncbi:MAG: hypothetical protein ACK4RV_17675 [Caulobacter sp.]